MIFLKKEREQIRKQLLKKITVGQLITYLEFQELYQPYMNIMSEIEFANILEINPGNYNTMKNKGTRAKILKSFKKEVSDEEKKKIIQEVLTKVRVGQSITYIEFQELYQPYTNMINEIEFASILGISYGNYNTMKNKGTGAKILKSIKKETGEEEKKKIIQEVLTKVRAGQLITYLEFQKLYQPYIKIMSEIEFANILEISYGNYNTIKSSGTRARILKSIKKETSEEEKKKIIQEVLSKVRIGQSITYLEFQELYQPYINIMSEMEFANILGISYDNYNNIKHRGTRAKILKNSKKEVSDEEKKKIIQEVLTKVRAGQLITYLEFQKLYQPYIKIMSEIEFANILEISYGNYNTIKSSGTRARILKSIKKETSEEEKKKIIQEVLSKVRIGQSITYLEFQELYQPYINIMSEMEFANILGISYDNYKNIKYKGIKTTINDCSSQNKINQIKHLIRDSRYYTKEELEILCSKCEIELPIIFNIAKVEDGNINIEILNRNGQIWIGDVACTKNFAKEYSEYMIKIAIQVGSILCAKYNCQTAKDDFVSDSILYIIENGGAIEKNFGADRELVKKVIFTRIFKYLELLCLNKSHNKMTSTFQPNSNNNAYIEDGVEEKILKQEINLQDVEIFEEKIIIILKYYLMKGYTEEEAMLIVSNYMKMSVRNVTAMLKEYMIAKQKVKVTSNGRYILI